MLTLVDIDYMKHYRDFEMDPNTFPVDLGQQFLSKLHANHQHYIPIVDSVCVALLATVVNAE
jgi:alpha-glucosidase